ncbi:MAG: hypothetical protein IPL33_21035 [Sphingobacteriales bacterium]|nr:hypothetical protein [Sphingobacteriales bacterium]
MICAGDPIPTLLVTAASGTMVNWYNTPTGGTAIATGWSFTPTQAGIYYAEAVSVDDTTCRSGRVAVELSIDEVTVNAVVDASGAIPEGTTVELAAFATSSLDGALSYQWSPSDDLSCNMHSNPFATRHHYHIYRSSD